jgi:hypothetical protein
MTAIFILLLLPAAASAAPAAPASTSAVAEAPLFPRCRDGALDVDALVADRAGLQAAASVPLSEIPDYLACRGLAAARPSCPALEGLTGGLSDAAASCRDLEWEAKFVHAILRRGDAVGLCRGRFPGGSPDALNATCASLIESARSGRPEDVCAAYLSAGVGREKDTKACASRMSYWTGKPESCDALSEAVQRDRCRQLAALVAGLRGAKSCAASPLCSALEKGDSAACAPLKAALSRRVCARAESEARRRARQKQEDLKKAQAEKAEAARRERAKAKEAKANASRKPQFQRGQPMKTSTSVTDVMKKLSRGEKVEAPKPAAGEEDGGGSDDQ